MTETDQAKSHKIANLFKNKPIPYLFISAAVIKLCAIYRFSQTAIPNLEANKSLYKKYNST